MEELHPAPVPGTLVRARGRLWHVRQTRRLTGCVLVTLESAGSDADQPAATLLLPFDRLDPVAEHQPVRRKRQAVARLLAQALSRQRPARGLWSATEARIDLWPWQLAPALAVLGGATRMLLADAVGLGKTVQAGLILAELSARGLVNRALVLAPASVRSMWAEELTLRFRLPASVLDLPALLQLEGDGPTGANPWARASVVVSSIDLVKRPEVCAAVERAPLDLLIVDEAHHATPGTDRHAVVARLARLVPWFVAVTATPHSGDTGAYRALLALGAVEGEGSADRMRMFRRTHHDVRFAVPRRTHLLRVTPSAEEAALQAGVLAYARDLCRGPQSHGPGLQLLAGILARRATSSPAAARLTLERRLALIASSRDPSLAIASPLPWEEGEDDGADESPWLATPGLDSPERERERLEDLIARAALAEARPSKLARLRRLLALIAEPVIVFSEFRDTLDACRRALDQTTSVTCLHGGLDAAERHRQLARFLEGRARVLLATDVAGEGLNLQGPARLVITIEWPWSPLRLEQRIGRVHRLGQSRPVHAIHLTAGGTYEETVVARLIRREAQATRDLEGSLSDSTASEIAGLVLGVPPGERVAGRASAAAYDASLERPTNEEAARLNTLRRLNTHGRQGWAAAGWAPPRHALSVGHVIVAVEVSRHSASGWLQSSVVVPVMVTLRDLPENRRSWRLTCRRLAADPRVRQAAVEAGVDRPNDDGWAAVRDRLEGLRRLRDRQRPRSLQPSLFDRRALAESDRSDAVRACWQRWQARTQARLGPAGRGHTRTRVVALLPCGALASQLGALAR